MQSWLDAWARDVVRDLVAFMEAPSLRNVWRAKSLADPSLTYHRL